MLQWRHEEIAGLYCNGNLQLVLVVISKTYIASKSAHRLLATYNSSIDLRFCPLHSAIIFSRSSIDCSSAAIRASLVKI